MTACIPYYFETYCRLMQVSCAFIIDCDNDGQNSDCCAISDDLELTINTQVQSCRENITKIKARLSNFNSITIPAITSLRDIDLSGNIVENIKIESLYNFRELFFEKEPTKSLIFNNTNLQKYSLVSKNFKNLKNLEIFNATVSLIEIEVSPSKNEYPKKLWIAILSVSLSLSIFILILTMFYELFSDTRSQLRQAAGIT
ncbi:MAG: hypothetical protein MHPSP_000445 [Paramarteilia canceri]